ncbi:MAG: hypothetical protein Q8Q35_00490 [Nanoarchaeota archaeon]|nr:hypothetical protein [Nanoarchaeota archaeon]
MDTIKYDEIETSCPNCKIIFKIKDMFVDEDTNRLLCINCKEHPGAKIHRIR